MNTPQQKIALVTGANRGIGLETARQLAQAGVTVILAARDQAKAAQAAATLKAEGLDAVGLKLDVTSTADIQAAARPSSAATTRPRSRKRSCAAPSTPTSSPWWN
jgi:NAD(P)-dependent dehydrogenase (short-subunit alcohol dehydrogenase family)